MAQVDRVFPKLQFKDPVELAFDPSGSRLWVLEVGGRLVSFAPRAEAAAADVSSIWASFVAPLLKPLDSPSIRDLPPTDSCIWSMSFKIGIRPEPA